LTGNGYCNIDSVHNFFSSAVKRKEHEALKYAKARVLWGLAKRHQNIMRLARLNRNTVFLFSFKKIRKIERLNWQAMTRTTRTQGNLIVNLKLG